MPNIYCIRCGKEITKKHAIMYHDKCHKCWNKWWNLTHCVNCGREVLEQSLNKDNWCSACAHSYRELKKYSGGH
ncbi:MAG: hypothetical protein ACFFAH_15910 [Promethearchaeota archaeon]